MLSQQAAIGVLDSGVGGISTLRTLTRMLPNENFIFYGDSANAPYGEKDAATVQHLTSAVIEQLRQRDVKAIVIACNTATSAAKSQMMTQYPEMPILGIEPALKMAVDAGKHNILVMGTPLTISLPKYRAQVDRFKDQTMIHSLPCAGLADLVEQGHDGLDRINARLDELLAPYRDQPIDAVVLGCTHYPFIGQLVAQRFAQPVTLFTGYEGLGHNLIKQLDERRLLRQDHNPQQIEFMSSRQTKDELALYQQLFQNGIGI